MFPLLLLGALGAGVGVYENKAATEAADLEPKIFGMNAQNVGIGAGLLAMLLGGPMLAPLGMSVAVGSYVSKDAMARAKQGLDQIVADAVKKQLGSPDAGGAQPPAPPALPGPVARNGGQFLNMLRSFAPQGGEQAAA